MERIETLIQNLQQQLARNVSTAQLLSTAELLILELRQSTQVVSEKISIQMPYVFVNSSEKILEEKKNVEVIENKDLVKNTTNIAVVVEAKEVNLVLAEPVITNLLKKPTQILVSADEEQISATKEINFNEIIENIPTYSVQPNATKQIVELNDLMVGESEENLNDIHKKDVIEVAHAIKEAPVKDLRKVIGVNDKYLFINELFKGDEALYEKSLKTINSFAVYPEAETWMKKELLLKLEWSEQAVSTKQFYNIIMRKFS